MFSLLQLWDVVEWKTNAPVNSDMMCLIKSNSQNITKKSKKDFLNSATDLWVKDKLQENSHLILLIVFTIIKHQSCFWSVSIIQY